MAELLSLEAARALVLAAVPDALPVEASTLDASLGRVLARDVVATTALPPWDNSAMDGYAIRALDVAGATEDGPVRLAVVGEVRAGDAPDVVVRPGSAVRIATGARLPEGGDAVVPVEETTPLDRAGVRGERGRDATGPLPEACLVHAAVEPGGSIRRRGEDLAAGAVVVPAGATMTAGAIAAAAGSGNAEVTVHRRPRVAVLATGEEVRPAGAPLGAAGIPDANGPGLRALVRAAGCEAVDLGIAPDRLEDVVGRLRAALGGTEGTGAGADAIIVSGGVSVGPYDVVRPAFEALGRVELWRVAIQPGKPFAFGVANRPEGAPGALAGDRSGGRPALLFGLPGNPVSSFVTFELFVRPALRRLAGHRDPLRPTDRAVLTERVTKSAGRRAFVRVGAVRDETGSVRRDGRGRVVVSLAGGQGSHMLGGLAGAEALAVIPEAVDAGEPGDEVELWWLDRP